MIVKTYKIERTGGFLRVSWFSFSGEGHATIPPKTEKQKDMRDGGTFGFEGCGGLACHVAGNRNE